MGAFWGGPLVAREYETGTNQFAWMQSITRRRWLMVKGSFWPLAQGILSRGGRVIPPQNGLVVDNVPFSAIPVSCRALLMHPQGDPGAGLSCVQAGGLRQFITYQPASRYWAFQGIETGIFVVLAAALIAVAAIVVLRRDA